MLVVFLASLVAISVAVVFHWLRWDTTTMPIQRHSSQPGGEVTFPQATFRVRQRTTEALSKGDTESSTTEIPKTLEAEVTLGGHVEFCSTEDCLQMSELYSASITPEKDPCDNFYKYVCTGFVNSRKPLSRSASSDLEDKVQVMTIESSLRIGAERVGDQTPPEKAAAFLKECLLSGVDGYQNRRALVEFMRKNSLGFDGSESFDAADIIVRFVFRYHLQVIFATGHAEDVRYSFYKQRLFLKESQELEKWADSRKELLMRGVYKEHVSQVLKATGVSDRSRLKFLVETIEGVEASLLGTQTVLNRNAETKTFLLSDFGSLSGNKRVENTWEKSLWQYSRGYLPGDHTLEVKQSAINLFQALFKETVDMNLRLYISWETARVLLSVSSTVSHEKYYPNMMNCVEITFGLLDYAFISPYLFSAVDHFRLQAVRDVMRDIRAEAVRVLNTTHLFTNETSRQTVLSVVQLMKLEIRYPQGVETASNLTKYYGRFRNVRGPFLKSFIDISAAFSSNWVGDDIGESHSPARSFRSYLVKPFYDFNSNVINYPAGMTFPPFYSYNALRANNYGSLGHTLATLMTQAVFQGGPRYGHDLIGPLVTESLRSKHIQASDCLKALYRYAAGTLDLPSFWPVLVSDILGMLIAMNAYKRAPTLSAGRTLPGLERFTPEQMFFIGHCFIHCSSKDSGELPPHQYRCNVPVMSSDDFSDAFSCTPSSRMHPTGKCTL